MSVTIVHPLSESFASDIFAKAGEDSPLRAVAWHVAKAQIDRAFALTESVADLIRTAEQELIRLYVGDDFCGLCGRYTNHVGEH